MNRSFNRLSATTLIVLLVTLLCGLTPKDFNFSNNVRWLKDRPGIHFTQQSLAYTYLDDELLKLNPPDTQSFSIEIALKPEIFNNAGFKFIASIHGDTDADQLLIGQWRSYIIVMNGDDYAHKRKTNRITTSIDLTQDNNVLLTITTGESGTRLYVDGRLKQISQFNVTIPEGDHKKLTIGSSVHGSSFWKGDLYGLALYKHELSLETISSHFKTWLNERNFNFSKYDTPLLLYLLDENKGTTAKNYTNSNNHLLIPQRLPILEKHILYSRPYSEVDFNKSFIIDFTINLFGFIPLGFFLSAYCSTSKGVLRRNAIPIAILLGFFVSLFIETFQSLMISRSSDALDLILNTIGAVIGVTILQIVRGKKLIKPLFRQS